MKTHYSALARIGVIGSAASTILIALIDPMTQHGEALARSGLSGLYAVAFMTAFVLIGAIDVTVNDVAAIFVQFKSNYLIQWTHKYRHIGFMAIAAGQLGWMWESYKMQGMEAVLIRYCFDFLFATFVAGYGVWQHREIIRISILARFGATD